MIIGYRYYKIEGKALEQAEIAHNKMFRYQDRCNALMKELGADEYVEQRHYKCRVYLTGFIFVEEPDLKIWKKKEVVVYKGKQEISYIPKRNKKGKEIAKKMDDLPDWNCDILQNLLGWRDFEAEGRLIGFGYNYNQNGFFFRTPEMIDESQNYNPHKDLVELTLAQYREAIIC